MHAERESTAYRTWVMAMLVLVYALNFVDRQILGILAVPIKAELALTDTQLGLLGGLAFALFYSALGIPVAMLADRRSRTGIIALALAVWSAMTAACGLANGFWSLFLARLGVGIGEAGGVAPAYSLIADYYPSQQRARALSVYSFGIPIGSALGIVGGGVLASLVGWRYAFFVVGLAGLLLAPLFRLSVREPPRGRYDAGQSASAAPLANIARTLAAKPSFWLMSLGAATASMIGYGLFFWLPSFFVRSFALSLVDAALYYGAIVLIGGLVGIALGGILADRLGRRDRRFYVLIPAIAFLVTVPCYALALLSPSLRLTFVAMLVPMALSLAWLGPILSAVAHIVPPNMRATASAIFLFVINLIGIGVGTVALGVLSDLLQQRFGDDALRYAILAGTGLYVIAALLLLLSSRWLGRDWEGEPLPATTHD